MKMKVFLTLLMTAALVATGGATAQHYRYGYDAQRYGGTTTITTIDGRGGVSTRTIIHGPTSGNVVIIHPHGALTTGTIDQFGNWYTITTPGNIYNYPRPVR